MPLIDTLKILKDARDNGYAIGAFNIDNLNMALGVISAAEALMAPVIIQTTYTTVNHGSAAAFAAMIRALATNSAADIALHLDHGNSYEICAECVDSGYTSIMIDGSGLPLDNNIQITKKVTDYAKKQGVSVEGELGRVGGTEDEMTAESSYTDVGECVRFVNETGIDFVAIGVGTAHGIYDGLPKLNIDRIKEIFDAVSIPLVLHGASGLSKSTLRDCIGNGISKVNFATELRMAYTEGVRDILSDNINLYDPKKYQLKGRQKVSEIVLEKLKILSY